MNGDNVDDAVSGSGNGSRKKFVGKRGRFTGAGGGSECERERERAKTGRVSWMEEMKLKGIREWQRLRVTIKVITGSGRQQRAMR